MKIFLLVVNRSLSKYRHAVRHRLQQPLVVAHLAVVGAQEQRLDAVKDLLLTVGDSIQVQVDEVGNELEREALEFILI